MWTRMYGTFRAVFPLIILAGTFSLVATSQPDDRVKLDVKTRFAEKAELTVPKNGFVYCLRKSDWARVVEVGEEYTLWLKNYERVQKGKVVTVTLEIELRTPSMVRSGKLLASRRVTVSYRFDGENDISDSMYQDLKQEMKNAKEEALLEAATVGRELEAKTREMIRELSSR